MFSSCIEQAKMAERVCDWDTAVQKYEAAFTLATQEGDAERIAELLRWIGTARRSRGEWELAVEAYEASLLIAEIHGFDSQVAAGLNCMAALEHVHGDVVEARKLYLRARAIAESQENDEMAAMLDVNLGALENLRGDVHSALASYGSALERYRSLGDGRNIARVLNNLGMARLAIGAPAAAQVEFDEAAELAQEAGDLVTLGTIELNRAELFLKAQQFEAARESCARSLDIFSGLKTKGGLGEAYRLFGMLFRETGMADKANAHFAMALGLAEVSTDRLLQAEVQIEWALVHLELGRNREGIGYLNRALTLFDALQAHREVLDIREKLERLEGLYLPAVKKWCAQELSPDQARHAERVADYACWLGAAAGMQGWELAVLRVGALLHDIGKTVVDLQALDEYQPRTSSEGHRLRTVHTIAGSSIAEELNFPPEVRAVIRHHHEEFCGRGYPDRLSATRIPLEARIVCIADSFDSLVNPLGTRTAFSAAEALSFMQEDAGGVFDPELLGLFATACVAAGPQAVAA